MIDFGDAKRVLIVVPHEDDEINLMGGLLPLLTDCKLQVSVCFVTNGDYDLPGEVRIKEALASLECLGVHKDNVYFLGYPDSSDGMDHSLYNAEIPVRSKWGGIEHTYGCEIKDEYRMQKCGVHALNTYGEMKNDLTDLLKELHPDIIFCCDLDGHHDHRMTSLLFEQCLYDICRSYSEYRPEVFKGFCYATAYEGRNDFFEELNVASVCIPEREQLAYNADTELDNPFFKWEARVRFPVAQDILNRNLSHNRLAHACCCHQSQYLRKRIGRLLNADVVFWRLAYSELHKFSISNIAELHEPLCLQMLENDAVSGEAESKIKICHLLINDDFAYELYYVNKETRLNVATYRYHFKEDCQIVVKNKNCFIENGILHIPQDEQEAELELISSSGKHIDKCRIKRISSFQKLEMQGYFKFQKAKNYISYKVNKMFYKN